MIGNHDPVKMVILVLDDARGNSAQAFLPQHPVLVVVLHLDANRPFHRFTHSGNGKAALLHDFALVRFIEEHRIDHDPLEILATRIALISLPKRRAIHDEKPYGAADLRRCESYPLGLVHGLPHVFDERGQPFHALLNVTGLLPEDRIAIGHNR